MEPGRGLRGNGTTYGESADAAAQNGDVDGFVGTHGLG